MITTVLFNFGRKLELWRKVYCESSSVVLFGTSFYSGDNGYYLGSSNYLSSVIAASRLDVAGLPAKKLSFNPTTAREVETPRKPFAPVAPTLSHHNIPTAPSHQNIPTMPSQRNIAVNPSQHISVTLNQHSIPSTPSQRTFTEADENMTPKTVMPIPTPKTPMTVSVPMQVAGTPAPVCLTHEVTATKTPDVTEYSFEERRLAYYLSRRD